MTAALAVISAALALGAPPERGLVLETNAGVQLQTLGGRRLATLRGYDLAIDQAIAHEVVLRDRRGKLTAFDGRRLRAVTLRRGCRTTDRALVVCARTIRSGGRIVARAPRGIGHWIWAERSPRRDAVLAQWEAECETPVAYLVADGKVSAFGRESVALGWLPAGEALIHFPNGPCAGDSRSVRGIYAAVSTRKLRLLLRTSRFAQYLMWGG